MTLWETKKNNQTGNENSSRIENWNGGNEEDINLGQAGKSR